MSPPKRAIFSLNVDSQVESLYDERTHHHGNSLDNSVKKVTQVTKPVTGGTHIEIVKNKGDGKVEKSVEHQAFEQEKDDSEGDNRAETTYSTDVTGSGSGPSVHTIVKKKKKVDVDEEYDTNDL